MFRLSGKIGDVTAKRFYPLYVATFLQSFALWYAVEKLFMRSIGFNNRDIAKATIVFTLVTIIFSVPLGILADRKSRKSILIFASICLSLAALICGISQSFWQYTLGLAFWGLFSAAYVGIYETLTYEVLVEEHGNNRKYEWYFGRFEMFNTLSLILGALLSGAIAKYFGLRMTYYLSVPVALLSIYPLIKFAEPTKHKTGEVQQLLNHIGDTFRYIFKSSNFWAVVTIVLLLIDIRILFEFGPIWFVTLALPTLLFGPAIAAIQASMGFCGPLASYIKTNNLRVKLTLLLAIIISALLSIANVALAIGAISLLILLLVSINIVSTRILHEKIPNNLRAGAMSLVTTMGLIIFLPVAYLFGWLSDKYSIFTASKSATVILLLAIYPLYKTVSAKNLVD